MTALPEGFLPIDMITPVAWQQFFGRQIGRATIGVAAAFSPTAFFVGIELICGASRGIAFGLGPLWVGFAVLRRPTGAEAMTDLPEGFVPHDGGPCPVPLDLEVTVLYADGGWSAGEAGFWTGWEESDQMNSWSWNCDPYNRIIAYRPTQQETKL